MCSSDLVAGQPVALTLDDVEILSEDIPGWQVASEGRLTVALDVTITPALREEGIAREFVNRVQNLRKENGFEVTDRIDVRLTGHESLRTPILNNKNYICAEILAASLEWVDTLDLQEAVEIEVDDAIKTLIRVSKHA